MRYDILTSAQKLTRVSLIYLMKPTTKKWKTETKLKSKKYGYAQKYRQTVQEIRGVSPEEEKKGYGGKNLQKREVLSLE